MRPAWSVQQLAEARGAARDGKIGFGILKLDRAGAALPGRDLVEQPLAQDRGVQRTAVEQDGVHARAVPEEIGQVARDRAVGRVGKTPVAQTRLGAKRPGARIADRKKAIEHQPLDLVARQRRRLRPGHEARTPGPATPRRNDPAPSREPESARSFRSRHDATR